MTISDEQLQRDKKYFFEFAQSDEAGLDFAQIKFCETMVAYISEVERLRAELVQLQKSKEINSQLQQNFFNEAINQMNSALEKLQAENAKLRKERDEAFDAGVVASQRMP